VYKVHTCELKSANGDNMDKVCLERAVFDVHVGTMLLHGSYTKRSSSSTEIGHDIERHEGNGRTSTTSADPEALASVQRR
jgi:hypothetical protein